MISVFLLEYFKWSFLKVCLLTIPVASLVTWIDAPVSDIHELLLLIIHLEQLLVDLIFSLLLLKSSYSIIVILLIGLSGWFIL